TDALPCNEPTRTPSARIGSGLTTAEPIFRVHASRATIFLLALVSEGGFEPPRAIRPLGPQPSASAKLRHSDRRGRAICPAPGERSDSRSRCRSPARAAGGGARA